MCDSLSLKLECSHLCNIESHTPTVRFRIMENIIFKLTLLSSSTPCSLNKSLNCVSTEKRIKKCII
jgi:hypothetical protein